MTTTNNNNTLADDVDMLTAAPDPSIGLDDAARPDSVPSSQQKQPQRNPPALAEETTTTMPPLDDIERMLCHEWFPALLDKAIKVKQLRQAMDEDANNNNAPSALNKLSTIDPNQVITAATRIKEAFGNNKDMPVVRKGMYPLTDSLLEEAFEVLHKETERCQEWFEQKRMAPGGGGRRKGKQIAVKYAKWQTDLLMRWMIENRDYPFPTNEQIQELGEQTGLTDTQIINWTTNVRKRNLKACVEQGKKPHHFIDFVFLASDRDRRRAQGLPVPIVPQVKPSKGLTILTSRRTNIKTAGSPKADPVLTGAAPPKADPVLSASQYPHHGSQGAFRQYSGGPVYQQPHSMQQQQRHPSYQQPLPAPPNAYHARLPSNAVETAAPAAESLPSPPAAWKDNDDATMQETTEFSRDNSNAVPDQAKSGPMDILANVTAIMAPRRDSLNSIEMIDLSNDDSFLDMEYSQFAKKMTANLYSPIVFILQFSFPSRQKLVGPNNAITGENFAAKGRSTPRD